MTRRAHRRAPDRFHYQYKLYALDEMLALPSDATRDAVLQAMDGHILRASVYYGKLERLPQQ